MNPRLSKLICKRNYYIDYEWTVITMHITMMVICSVLIRSAESAWKKEIVFIVRFVFYALVIITCTCKGVLSEIKDIADTKFNNGRSWFGLTQHSRLTYKWTTVHVRGVVGRRLSSSRWYTKYVRDGIQRWEVSRTMFADGILPVSLSHYPFMGVMIALIDTTSIIHLSEHFTYPNKF